MCHDPGRLGLRWKYTTNQNDFQALMWSVETTLRVGSASKRCAVALVSDGGYSFRRRICTFASGIDDKRTCERSRNVRTAGADQCGPSVEADLRTNISPRTRTSIFVRRKHSIASSGRQTMGSLSLNDVLSTT